MRFFAFFTSFLEDEKCILCISFDFPFVLYLGAVKHTAITDEYILVILIDVTFDLSKSINKFFEDKRSMEIIEQHTKVKCVMHKSIH